MDLDKGQKMTKSHKNELIRYSIKVVPLVLLIACVGLYRTFTEDPQERNVNIVNRVLLEEHKFKVPLNESACVYTKENFKNAEGYIPYLQMYYCAGEGTRWMIWIFFVVWIALIFYILGSTAEEFFCPALMKITKKLHLSPNVAGVTFLALGNGSPDIFSSFVGINNGLFPQAIGELMGAGLFVSSVVVAAVIFFSPIDVQPPRRPYIRDVLFFLGAIFLIIVTLIDHQVTLTEAMLLIGYYLCYVLVVLLGRWIYQKRKRDISPTSASEPTNSTEEDKIRIETILEPLAEVTTEAPFLPDTETPSTPTYLPKVGIIEGEGRITLDKIHAKLIKRSSRQLKRLYSYRRNIKEYFDWDKMDTKDMFLFFTLLPLTIARHITIPWMAEGKYLRLFCLMYPLTISMFFWVLLEGWTIHIGRCPLWGLLLVVGTVLAAVLFEITEKHPRKPPRCYSLFSIPSLVMSVVWIYIAANELVAVLEAVGQILGISSAIMGLTVLAWGNSVSDMISNSIISKKSFPQMALAACYAAPLCNMLLGLGLSWAFYIIKTGTPFALASPEEFPNTVFFAVVLLIANLTFSFLFVVLSKFKLTNVMGGVLLLFYVAFTTMGLLTEMGIILKNTPLFWRVTGSQ